MKIYWASQPNAEYEEWAYDERRGGRTTLEPRLRVGDFYASENDAQMHVDQLNCKAVNKAFEKHQRNLEDDRRAKAEHEALRTAGLRHGDWVTRLGSFKSANHEIYRLESAEVVPTSTEAAVEAKNDLVRQRDAEAEKAAKSRARVAELEAQIVAIQRVVATQRVVS